MTSWLIIWFKLHCGCVKPQEFCLHPINYEPNCTQTFNDYPWGFEPAEKCVHARALTWTLGRRPQHRWQGRAPSGWRCVPAPQDSEHAWLCRKPYWLCWRRPACCSGRLLRCPGCSLRARPRWAHGSWRAADTAGKSSPENSKFNKQRYGREC